MVMVLVPMILSLTVHEFAHAWSAKKLGDPTAEAEGRLTLNPVAHIDPMGTIILPIILIISNAGFFFGWAKPVPVNPMRFTRKVTMRTGMLIVAAAGPLSNLVLATISVTVIAVLFHGGALGDLPMLRELLVRMLSINVALAVFNMIPVGPLDGQKVLTGLLKGETATRFERFNHQYGSWLLIAVIIFGGRLIAVPYAFILEGLLAVFGLR
jgi:Zn-dependent protease